MIAQKKIKVKFCGYSEKDTFSYSKFILDILKSRYDVELSENPEYIFFNESSSEYLKFDCIRIFYTGENITPNFNLCDYAIGFDYLTFEDRYFRLPLFLVATFYNNQELLRAGDMDFNTIATFTEDDLAKKSEFCSFVYSNYLASESRVEFLTKLNNYKIVNSGGRFLNNVGGAVKSKLDFEAKHKFSIAFENSSRSGYSTEKICTSFAAKTIPIYFGDPRITDEFNRERFINCHEYDSFEAVIERVKEIDSNDKLYIEILNKPIRNPHYNFTEIRKRFTAFLYNTIDQDLSLAKRRTINPSRAIQIERGLQIIARIEKIKGLARIVLSKIYQPFKKFPLLEKLKVSMFRKG